MSMTLDSDRVATAAVLAHGALNSLTALNVAVELLASRRDEDTLTAYTVDMARSQMATVVDSLRLITLGLPDEARQELDDLDNRRIASRPKRIGPTVTKGAGKRPRPRADTRKRVQAAALHLCELSGFDATSVNSIAEASSISTRTFFRYFASKQDAIWSWVEDEADSLCRHVSTAPASMTDREALRLGVLRYAATITPREEQVRRYVTVLARTPSLAARSFESTAVDALVSVLASRAGTARPSLEQRVLVRSSTAAVVSATQEYFVTAASLPLAVLMAHALQIILPADV